MKQFIRNKLRGHSINLWIVGVILVFILPLNIFLILGMQEYMKSLEDQIRYSCTSVLQLYLGQLQKEMESTDTYFFELKERDSDFIRVANMEADSAYIVSLHSLYRKWETKTLINYLPAAYYFYSESTGKYIMALDSTIESESGILKEYLKEINYMQDTGWKTIEIGDQYYLLRTYTENGIFYGTFISLESFRDQIEQNLEYPYDKLVFSNGDNIDDTQDHNELMVSAGLEKTDLSVEIYINKNVVYRSLPILGRITYIASFVSLAEIPLILLLFRYILIVPLNRLDHALHELEEGNKDYRIRTHPLVREMAHMEHSFNNMAGQIENLKIESYENELEKKQIQLKNIQLQVRPHFLLNIFHLIFSMAQLENYKGIQKLAKYLSSYFRSLLTYGDTNTVEREIALVKAYCEILDIQYPDCFEVTYDIEEQCFHVLVPTLLLHSLMENISKYAIQIGTYVNVCIKIYEDEKGISLEVFDDGPGIPENILEQIRSGSPVIKPDGKHIGIDNARKRLQMLFSNDAKLLVESKIAEGTKVRILIPKGRIVYENITGR